MSESSIKLNPLTRCLSMWRACIVSLLILCFSISAFSQCAPPSNLAHTSTASTCASNGSIQIGAPTGGSGDYLEYALYNAANTLEVRPWQIATQFSDLASGSYTLRSRYVCGVGYSNVYTKSVTVAGNYLTPNITSITVQRRAQCNNGRILVNATGSSNPKTYALVASLSAPEPIAATSYIRIPQTSNIFDSLSAGIYYVRVYDACGSYVTNSVTVGSFTQVNPFPNAGLRITYWLCDSLTGQIVLNNLSDHVAATTDSNKRLWIVFPDGSTDTLITPTTSGTVIRSFSLPLAKLGVVGAGLFPDNIGGTWPKHFQVGYKDACGTVFTYDYDLCKPNLGVTFTYNSSASSNSCDSSAYRLTLTSSTGCLINLHGINLNNKASYSLNGGASWTPITTTSGALSQDILMAVGSAYNVCFAYCGDTTCLTGTIPTLPMLNASAYESSRYACFGKSGFLFRANSGIAPVVVTMVSGPAGQSWLTDTIYTINSPTYDWMSSSRNMVPGTYIFKFTDACGRILHDTITTDYPYQTYDFDFSFPCGSSNMEISFSNDAYRNINTTSTIANLAGGFKAQIYKADNTLATATVFSSVFGVGKITIPSATISALPNGNYYIRIWKDGADSCTVIDKPWVKTASLISLSNSLAVAACPGTPTTGTVIGIAQGGSGGFAYSLYQGSVAVANLVAGPQASGVFNGLDESATYIVTVSDTCGRGTQATVSFNSTPLPVYNNTGGFMPCPGDTLVLNVNNMPEVHYQWYKNNIPVLNDTMATFTIAGITTSDAGNYKVELTVGTCAIFLASFELNPALCGTPLSIELNSFEAKTQGNTALLLWSTLYENNNKNFIIERSDDGSIWETIGNVKSKAINGNSNNPITYSFTDANPKIPVSYYRLKQVDYDGKFAYSMVRILRFSEKNRITIAPNPTTGRFQINGLSGKETVNIYNTVGQRINIGNSFIHYDSIDISHLPSGVYYVHIIDKQGAAQAIKILKN